MDFFIFFCVGLASALHIAGLRFSVCFLKRYIDRGGLTKKAKIELILFVTVQIWDETKDYGMDVYC